MNKKQQQYLQALGIQSWESKNFSPSETIEISSDETLDSNRQKIWLELEDRVKHCTLCELHKTRTHTVFGIGNKKADLLFVGEAPGANEDQQGIPFVGRAGNLLTSMLKAINIDRKDVYIANILKCRPPNNRDPLPSEVALCTPYLQEQINLMQPKLIVAVGRIAAQFLLKTNDPLSKLRGKLHYYGEQNTPLWITYHPAYLLRSPREKAKAYRDMLEIQKRL